MSYLRPRLSSFTLAALLLTTAFGAKSHAQEGGHLTLQDLLSVEPIGESALSPDGKTIAYASLSSSVRYFGASSITFLKNAASCAASTLGGGVVRVATAVPTSLKNSSWPAGEQMQSILTGFDEALWNW